MITDRLEGDKVEFYMSGAVSPFFRIYSSFQPEDDDIVNIQGKSYVVVARSFTVDYADTPRTSYMRCNVIVLEMPPPKQKRKRRPASNTKGNDNG